jgi:hypothetical protein
MEAGVNQAPCVELSPIHPNYSKERAAFPAFKKILNFSITKPKV